MLRMGEFVYSEAYKFVNNLGANPVSRDPRYDRLFEPVLCRPDVRGHRAGTDLSSRRYAGAIIS
jgi:hypothetical protein